MRVFITGSTGYIGSAVAAELARAGHEVLGLVRSEAKARQVAMLEVHPVQGDLADPDGYREAARAAQVLIHCGVEYGARQWELDRLTVDTFLSVARETGLPRLVLYTSGVWVYGETGDAMVDEGSRLAPPEGVKQRVGHERRVLEGASGGVRSLVARPGCVYGGSGGLTAPWFSAATREGSAQIVGDGCFRWSWVHVADLARGYRLMVESPFSGEIFNLTDRSRPSVLECARATGITCGGDGAVRTVSVEQARGEMGPLADCLVLDQHVDSSKAVRSLGWQPRHGGFVDGVGRYAAAWRAAAGAA